MTNKKGEQDWHIANKIRQQDLNMPLDSKGGFSAANVDLFGEKIPQVYFKAVTSKNDDGWMMCDCGNSGIDNNDHYVVTTEHLKADEVPDLCNDSKTFAELVAKLLNEYYSKK